MLIPPERRTEAATQLCERGLRSTLVPNWVATAEDRADAIRIALTGIASGRDPMDLVVQLEPLHRRNNTFPGEVLLELAADALELSGASRDHPLDYQGIRERYLPEVEFRGKTQHHRSHYALRAVALIRAGITPDLLDEVSWWHTDDLLVWSLFALFIYIRVCAERTSEPVEAVCERIATAKGVELGET